jgi:membrane protein YdbS with pleckstrin-like domain
MVPLYRVGVDAPPPDAIADGVARPLDPRYVGVQRTARAITVGVLAVVGAPVALIAVFAGLPEGVLGFWPLGVWTILVGLLGWWAHAWPPLAYRHTSYTVSTEGIEIRRGVIWRVVTNVPRTRVQHTDVSQGPLERSSELGTLVIYTAGTDDASVHLPGLTHPVALRIRDHLLPRAADDVV